MGHTVRLEIFSWCAGHLSQALALESILADETDTKSQQAHVLGGICLGFSVPLYHPIPNKLLRCCEQRFFVVTTN